MIDVRALAAADRDRWDALVAVHGGFMQSWAWSEFKELEGYTAIRLGVFDGAALLGGAIAYVYPTPAEAQLAAIPDGPVLDWDAPCATAAFDALVAALREWPGAERVAIVRVEPRTVMLPPALCRLARAPVDLVPHETLEIDLAGDDEMLARMKPKGRYNARVAARHGVEVTTSLDPADIHEVVVVLDETARYHDFALEPKAFFINLARALVPGAGRLVLARYRGITLAAAITVRHGSTVTYLYGGHLPLFRHVMASAALHWHVMREAAREGARTYDLYGYVGPDAPWHPYHGFSRFKEKLGGRHVSRIGSRDVIFYDRVAGAALAALGAHGMEGA